jgi:hypothetical protein
VFGGATFRLVRVHDILLVCPDQHGIIAKVAMQSDRTSVGWL